jgi:hypothetical protein
MPHFVPFVQATQGSTNNGVATFTKQYVSNNTLGSYLLALAIVNGGTITGVSDPTNGAWVQLGSQISTGNAFGGPNFLALFRVASNALSGGALNVTMTTAVAESFLYLQIYEFTGQAGATPETSVVATANASTSSVIATANPASVIDTNEEVIIVGYCDVSQANVGGDNIIVSSANGFTPATFGNNDFAESFCEFKGEATPGSYGDAMTLTNNTDFASFTIAVKSTSSAAPGGTYQIDDYGQGISFR